MPRISWVSERTGGARGLHRGSFALSIAALSLFAALASPFAMPAALADGGADARGAVAPAGPTDTVPTDDGIRDWIEALGADRYEDREAATRALIEKGAAAHAALREALGSSDPEVRLRVRFILGADLRRVAGLVAAVRRAPSRGQEQSEDPAWKELVALGERGVGPLVESARAAIARGDRRRVTVALRALETIASPQAIPGLASLVAGRGSSYTTPIAAALSRCGDAGALEVALRALLHRPQDAERRSVVNLVGALVGPEPAMTLLAEALEDRSETVREAAVNHLARRGGRKAAPQIARLVQDPSPRVQARAIAALGKAGDPAFARAVRPFLSLEDKGDARFLEAVTAIGQLGDKEAAPLLRSLLEAKRSSTVQRAVEALGRLRDRASTARIAALLDPKSRSYGTQRAVLRTLQAIGDPAAYQPLVDYIEKNGRYATQAAVSLGAVRHPEAGKYLLDRFREAESSAAASYLRALIENGDPAVLSEAALLGASKPEKGGYTRTVAVQLLGRYRPEGAFEALSGLLEEPTVRRDARYRAIEALGVLAEPRAKELLETLAESPADRHDALRALVRYGETKALTEEVETALARAATMPADDQQGRNVLGIELTTLGRFAAAREQFEAMLKANPRNDTAFYNLACVEALAGHPKKALDLLQKARDVGYRDWQHVELDHDFRSLRALPRYKAMLDAMRDPYATYRNRSSGLIFGGKRGAIMLPARGRLPAGVLFGPGALGVGGGAAGRVRAGMRVKVRPKTPGGAAPGPKAPGSKKPAPKEPAPKKPAPKASPKTGPGAAKPAAAPATKPVAAGTAPSGSRRADGKTEGEAK